LIKIYGIRISLRPDSAGLSVWAIKGRREQYLTLLVSGDNHYHHSELWDVIFVLKHAAELYTPPNRRRRVS